MSEKKYFVYNESGEAVRVTEAEYKDFIKLHPEVETSKTPTFQTHEMKENRRADIDKVIEDLNDEELTSEDMTKIAEKVRTKSKKNESLKGEDDIEKENRERLDDDVKSFNTPLQQLDSINGKEARIQRIVRMLDQLQLEEAELIRIEEEVKLVSEAEKAEKEEKAKQEKKEQEEEQNQQ